MTSLITRKCLLMAIILTLCGLATVKADFIEGPITVWGQLGGWASYTVSYNGGNTMLPGAYNGGQVGTYPGDWDIFCLSLWDCPTGVNQFDAYTNFRTPGTGIEYNASSLATSMLSDGTSLSVSQKDAIQTLINHVYKPMLDARAAYQDAEDTRHITSAWGSAHDQYEMYNIGLQFAVWKIVNPGFEFEITGFDWDKAWIAARDSIDTSYLYDTAQEANEALQALVNGWLASTQSGIWDEPFATAYNYDITVFSGDNYKSFFTLSEGAAVPEPATLAIVGLGLAGLGWARTRRQSKTA